MEVDILNVIESYLLIELIEDFDSPNHSFLFAHIVECELIGLYLLIGKEEPVFGTEDGNRVIVPPRVIVCLAEQC